MSLIPKITTRLQSAFQLKPYELIHFSFYWLGLKTGKYRRIKKPAQLPRLDDFHNPWPDLPDHPVIIGILKDQNETLLQEADEILTGNYHRYGSKETQPIYLSVRPPLEFWSDYGDRLEDGTDIKDIWEDARFGWAATLARAYWVTGNDSYVKYFWEQFEVFQKENPPFHGPNWASAQEVALRMIQWMFCLTVFQDAPASTEERKLALVQSIFMHASRIPPTLSYAKAQNNNHLLSEAVGLWMAGLSFPSLPEGQAWQRSGWKLIDQCIQKQFSPDGEYIQHSTNYHRMVLTMLGLVAAVGPKAGFSFSEKQTNTIQSAMDWLYTRMDEPTGKVTNTGHNDGSNILPLTVCEYNDFRPVIQMMAQHLLQQPCLPAGPWNELAVWLGLPGSLDPTEYRPDFSKHLRIGDQNSWGILRAAHYTSRPAHADQLHVDLWWNGVNLLYDTGTFRYNVDPPWQNGLAGTASHNTASAFGLDQMKRAGKFLWINWAQAYILEQKPDYIMAEHDGYRKIGLIHRRTLTRTDPQTWEITDEFLPAFRKKRVYEIYLNWSFPDLEYQRTEDGLVLTTEIGYAIFSVEEKSAERRIPMTCAVVSGGQLLCGDEATPRPVSGWYSPTYAEKIPGLQMICKASIRLPGKFITTIQLIPNDSPVFLSVK